MDRGKRSGCGYLQGRPGWFMGGGEGSRPVNIRTAYIAELRNFIHKRGTAGRAPSPSDYRLGCRSCDDGLDLYWRDGMQQGTRSGYPGIRTTYIAEL
jgi:hypothetical protein